MVKFVELSAGTIRKADSYIPIGKKARIVQILAPGCVEDVVPDVNPNRPMPPLAQESTVGKRMVLSYILSAIYLHLVDSDSLFNSKEPSFEFSAAQYDQFSKLHRQLERFKRDSDPEIATKAYDILMDFRDMEKMLNVEVYNIIQAKNDLCTRLCEMIDKQTSPQSLSQAVEAMSALRSNMTIELRKRELVRKGKNSEAAEEAVK